VQPFRAASVGSGRSGEARRWRGRAGRRRAVSFACGLREPRMLWRGPEVTRTAREAPRGVVCVRPARAPDALERPGGDAGGRGGAARCRSVRPVRARGAQSIALRWTADPRL